MSKTIEQQFTDWVRKQDPEGQYDYESPTQCAFAQFLKAYGYAERPECDSSGWGEYGQGSNIGPMPEGVEDAVVDHPRTYGALLSRLEAAGRG